MTACIIAQGDPGTGKTGAVAALLDRGEEVGIKRVILADFDGNPDPLLVFAKNRDRLHIVPFVDELASKGGDESGDVTRLNAAAAIRRFTGFLTRGTKELGDPRTWGPETLLMVDSTTPIGESAIRLALKLNKGVTRDGAHIGIAMGEIEDAMRMVKQLKCHRYVICHLKIIAPKPQSSYGESEVNKAIKEEIAALQETGFFANLPGNTLARNIASMFSTALLFELSKKDELVIRTKPIKGYTVKVPAVVKDELPIEEGLLTIFKAMGYGKEKAAA